MEFAVAILVIICALGFDFTNGFHDAANAIATSVSTRALTPRVALAMAAVMNLIGALLGTAVATTIAKDIVQLSSLPAQVQLTIVLAALLGAVSWNLITWLLGMPSSSSHALIGGLAGAGVGASFLNPEVMVKWPKILEKVIEPMFLSPIVGFILAYFVMTVFEWIFRRSNPAQTYSGFRRAQIFSSAALALGHGLQDAQKSMGVIYMAAAAIGLGGATHDGDTIPLWIKLICAAAIAAGTFAGGKRIMKTLGSKIVDVDSARGFAAESVSATVLYVTAFFVHAPISTTHSVTTAIMGAGATKGMRTVNWGVASNIVKTWFITLPAAGVMGMIFFGVINALLNVF